MIYDFMIYHECKYSTMYSYEYIINIMLPLHMLLVLRCYIVILYVI